MDWLNKGRGFIWVVSLVPTVHVGDNLHAGVKINRASGCQCTVMLIKKGNPRNGLDLALHLTLFTSFHAS